MNQTEPIKDFINFHYDALQSEDLPSKCRKIESGHQDPSTKIKCIQIFQIDSVPGEFDLSPGLKVNKTIKAKKLPGNIEKECLIPIYVNDYKYDYLVVLSPQPYTISVTPNNLDFGLLNVGTLQVSQTLTISNASEKDFSFQVDVRECNDNVTVEPTRGKIRGKQSYQVAVRVVTLNNLDIECVIFVKCAFQHIPVRIKAKVIVPKMEVIHPNTTETFTCLEFPPTYFGLKCFINVFIRNYSAIGHMFGTFGEIDNKYIELAEAQNNRMDFKFFEMKPSDGVFQSNETRVFKFGFCPVEIDRNTKNIPYFFCKFVMYRFVCDYYCKQNALGRKSTEKSCSNITFCKSLGTSRSDPFLRESLSLYMFCKEKPEHGLNQTKNSYTRFYLYGSAEVPSVKIIPDSLYVENIPLNIRETRVIELKNNSKNLPIILHYKKTPFIFLESDFFHLNSLESIQISVHIEPKRLGKINTKIEFDLMYYNDDDLKVIGETKVKVEYNVSVITRKKYSISLSLKPNDFKNKITRSITLSNLLQINKDRPLTNYYNAFIRKKDALKSQSMISLKSNGEYDVTNLKKVLCKDVKLSKPGKLVVNEKIKRNDMFFLPLTPQEMANIFILPPVIRTPKIASYNFYDFQVLIQNFNSIPIRLTISTDREPNIIFHGGNRYILNKNEELRINISYKSGYIGYYVSTLYFIINESTALTVPVLADVVPPFLNVLTTDIELDSKNNSKYIEIENPLNINIPFMWLLLESNVIIEPRKGIIPPSRKIVCMVTYRFDENGPDFVVAKLHSGNAIVETVDIHLIQSKSKMTATELNFGNISLNEDVMDMVILKNNCEVNRLKFYVNKNEVPEGLSVFPLEGIIDPMAVFNLYVIAKFANCIIFNCFLKINTYSGDVLEIPIKGEVIYPDITINPININIDKIPSSTKKMFNVQITNNSPVPANLTFDLKEYEEFSVSKSIFPFSKDIITTITLDGNSTENVYIHFSPHGASSCQFYLPIVINNLLGPPILNDNISMKVRYYLTETYGENNEYSWMPEFLPCIRIRTLVSPPKIEISKTLIMFSTFPSKRDQSITIFISNPNHIESEEICVKYADLRHPLYLENNKVKNKKLLILKLKPNEKISFTISFKPNRKEFGEYNTLLPIYLHSDLSSNFHNQIKIEANYHKPDINVSLIKSKLRIDLNEKFVFSFPPITISLEKRQLKFHVTCTNHRADCKLEVQIMPCWKLELEPVKCEILEYSRKMENSGTYSIDLVTYEQDDVRQEYERWFEIKCSCGGYWLQKQERVVENSILTVYVEIEQMFTRSLHNCYHSYPLFPEGTHPLYNFMVQILASAECWLNTQVIFCTNTYEIRDMISYPSFIPPSSIELKRCTKLSGIPMLHIIGNLMGPEVLNSLIKESDFSNVNNKIKYLYDIYKIIIEFVINAGGTLKHLRPEHLFYFGGVKKYYEDIFDFKEYPLPVSSTMLNYNVFLRMRCQAWMDFVLQLYKCFYLKKIIDKHSKMIKSGHFKNTPLPDFFSYKNIPIQPTLYSESESFIMNWLQFHYNKHRNEIWENVVLNEISVDLYNNSLCDGLVFSVVLTTYCPYLKSFLQDLYFTPTRLSEKYHNVVRIIQSLEMINYSFVTKPEEIVDGNSIRLLMFSVYLFDILPNMYPVDAITFKTGLSTKTSNKIELENKNPFPVAYKVIFINDSQCFNTTIKFFEIKPKNKSVLKITYFAKFAKEINSTLVLSGECSGYRYVTNKTISLIGSPDIACPSTTISIQQEHLQIKHYQYLIQSPYKIKTNYRLQMSYDALKKPDDLLPILYHESRDQFTWGRLVPKINEFEFNENGEMVFPIMMSSFSYCDLDIWLYFRNEEIGDFVVKITSLVKDTLQREELFMKISKYVLHVTERPRKVILEIPNRSYLLVKSITAICVGLGGEEEGRFWTRVIKTPVGANILSSLYLVGKIYSNVPTPISCEGVMYKVTQKTAEDIIMPDTIYFEDECTDLTTKVPIILQSSTPKNFSFVLESIPMIKKRYYTVCFQFE